VEAFVRLSEIPAARLGYHRSVLLTGISASAQDMWNAVKPKATGKVRFEPDASLQKVMDGAPKATLSKRAAELGLPHSASIDEIVRDYEEAALAHHG
jgi:nucleoside-diphosphate-sugar epimerase